jgi:hypothetical protein
MIPVTVVDNFYNDPYSIREYALSQQFTRCPTGHWPGIRSNSLHNLNHNMDQEFMQRVLCLFFDLQTDVLSANFDINFHLTDESYEEGWVHRDDGTTFAGVVYLTPDAPVNCGTSLYSRIGPDNEGFDMSEKFKFYNKEPIDIDNYRTARDKHNGQFVKTLDIGNVFNRLVVYPGNIYHRESKFFGNTADNSRLTQVFFAQVNTSGLISPIEKSKNLATR